MTAKWDFDPLEKVISNRIGKLKLQNARVPLSVIVKLSYEMIYELMSFTPTCVPVELNQSASHREKYSQILAQTFSKISRFCQLKWAPEHVKLKYFLQGYCQFLQKYFYCVGQGAHKRIFHVHFIERLSQNLTIFSLILWVKVQDKLTKMF